MERHEALQDLSRDHFDALVRVKMVERALAGEPDARSPREEAERFLEAWEDEVRHHFREEEDVLLPVLARHGPVTGWEEVRRLVDDHAWFRWRVPELGERLEADAGWLELLEEVATRLKEHARFEERELFKRAQEVLTEGDLEDLHERSVAFRTRHRGPGSVGPDTHDAEL